MTGGAGYVGSHVVRQLGEAGYRVVVLDDLSSGSRDSLLCGELIVGDVGDPSLLRQLFDTYEISAVIHLAAYTRVEESITDPLKYFSNNTCKTLQLLRCCVEAGVRNFVFSSSAAVYGTHLHGTVAEDAATIPINPYGTSKLMSEWILRQTATVCDLNYVIFRYFNVAGCDPKGRIGQSTPDATLLIKVACEAAIGKRPYIHLFGTDYPTRDGTAVRDYVHVEDIADAHVKALGYLRDGGHSAVLNCGYGKGYSVREVLEATRRISGVDFTVRETAPRPGDPPSLVASADRIGELLGWEPRYADLDIIIRTTIEWEKKLLERGSAA